jgi:tetratricopeptide (TPR) repeat protein
MMLKDDIRIEFKAWQEYLLLLMAGLLLYFPSIFFGYTYFDDYTLIVQDAGFMGNLYNLIKIFSTDVFRADTVAYRPFLTASFMIDAQLGGIAPWIYHLTNLVIHLASVLALLVVLRRFSVGRKLSLLLAGLFLVHPALVQAVAWIPGRNDSLLGLWLLGSMLALTGFFRSRRWAWFFLHLLAYAGGLLVKEAALAFPAVCLILVFSAPARDLSPRHRYLLVMGWLVVSFVWFWIRTDIITAQAGAGGMTFNSFWENLQGVAGYLGKMIFPLNLSVIPVPEPSMLIYGVLATALICLGAAWKGIRDRAVFGAGLAMAALFLAPHLLRGTQFANYLEHRLYLPLIGLMMALSQTNLLAGIKWDRTWRLTGALAVVGLYAGLAMARLPVYYDHLSLLLNIMEKAPQVAISYQHLGYIYNQSGQYARAELYYQKAQRLEQDNKDIFHNLGVIYESQERWAEAEQNFWRGLSLAPRSSSLRYNLAYLYHQQGRATEAERQYRLAIISRPDYVPAQLNLGMLYHQQGRLDLARRQYLRTLEIDRDVAEAWLNLGILYGQMGMSDSAAFYLDRAFKQKPELKTQRKK